MTFSKMLIIDGWRCVDEEESEREHNNSKVQEASQNQLFRKELKELPSNDEIRLHHIIVFHRNRRNLL